MGSVFYGEIKAALAGKKLGALLNIRYYFEWKKYTQVNRNSISDKLPWISFPAIHFLKKNLKPSHCVFEYGGGGSTIFFLERVKEVVTVEHNKDWFDILQTMITGVDKEKWNGNLIEAEPLNSLKDMSIRNPHHYYSNDENFSTQQFKAYAGYIDKFNDGYFDFVLIDGRARPSCIKHAAVKVKHGGFLILDNAERTYYLEETGSYLSDYKLILSNYAPLPFIKTFTNTMIWQRL